MIRRMRDVKVSGGYSERLVIVKKERRMKLVVIVVCKIQK